MALHRDVVAEQRALLNILRECDERLERILRSPAEDRDQEEDKDVDLLALLKTRAIFVIGSEGLPYIYDNFFFVGSPRPGGNPASIFVHFPCADLLSRTDEPTSVRATIHLVQRADLTEAEQVFCARFLIELARIREENYGHLRNRLSKESEELIDRIKESLTASEGERENALQLSQRINRNVQGILACYDRFLADNKSGMKEFREVHEKMINDRRKKWRGHN